MIPVILFVAVVVVVIDVVVDVVVVVVCYSSFFHILAFACSSFC